MPKGSDLGGREGQKRSLVASRSATKVARQKSLIFAFSENSFFEESIALATVVDVLSRRSISSPPPTGVRLAHFDLLAARSGAVSNMFVSGTEPLDQRKQLQEAHSDFSE